MKRNKECVALYSILFVLCLPAILHSDTGDFFSGQDLHLAAGEMTIYRSSDADVDDYVIMFEDTFSMNIGSHNFFSDRAVVWLKPVKYDYLGTTKIYYSSQVYLEGSVTVKQGKSAKTTDLTHTILQEGQSLVSRFFVTGELFATSETQRVGTFEDLEELDLYSRGFAALIPVRRGPVISDEALVPLLRGEAVVEQKLAARHHPKKEDLDKTDLLGFPQPVVGKKQVGQAQDRPEVPEYQYPVNVAGLWQPAPEIESTRQADGVTVTTVIGRFYLWQKRNELGELLEFQADNAVIFSRGTEFDADVSGSDNTMASGTGVTGIYFRGNIIMTEGGSTIRAEEVYYDFEKRQALAVRAERRSFSPEEGIPIYIRAYELRQVNENVFEADDVVLTTSEFYVPQVAMHASKVVVTDMTAVAAREGRKVDENTFEAVIKDATLKLDQTPVFYWPKIRTNLERPDIPLRRLSAGYDDDYGASVETRWHLSKLLGRQQPPGVDSTLALDYYGKRGGGAGLDVDYRGEDHYGNFMAYLLNNRGTDDLGRTSDRRDLSSGEDIRGRVRLRHRHYLPYDWQATVEASYASDENFIEWFNRSEFDTGKRQESLFHLKRITDNWGISILNKFRLTDHRTVTEEMPTIEFHLKGQSFWDHKLTFYSDTQVSRFRDLYPNGSLDTTPEQFYTFITTRNEVDMPFMLNTIKLVPYVAATYGFNDQNETAFATDVNGQSVDPTNGVLIYEYGLRASTLFWKTYPKVRSRFWDLNGIRHIVKPHVEYTAYAENDQGAEMRDMVNFGIHQRWQTHRGDRDKGTYRTLDWMRLDINCTFMNHPEGDTAGPAFYMWNNPSIPMLIRRQSVGYGIVRDSLTADYEWRLSDVTTILSDLNYDLRSSELQQINFGVSRYVFPDISTYIGARYLKRSLIEVGPPDNIYEEGSFAVVSALTYALNERYTLTAAQEYNIEFGRSVRREFALIRKYHRMYSAISFSKDDSRDNSTLLFSMWPEGVSELALGSRSYVGLTSLTSEE